MSVPAMSTQAITRLSRFVRRLTAWFTAVTIVIYLGINLAVVYLPQALAAPVVPGGLLSWGIVLGFVGILAAIIATAVFVWIINTRGEALRQTALQEQNNPGPK